MQNINKDLSQEEIESHTWTPVKNTNLIWLDNTTNKYHFVMETEQLDTTPYNSIKEAENALISYCENIL